MGSDLASCFALVAYLERCDIFAFFFVEHEDVCVGCLVESSPEECDGGRGEEEYREYESEDPSVEDGGVQHVEEEHKDELA